MLTKSQIFHRVLAASAKKTGFKLSNGDARHRALRDLRAYQKNRAELWALRQRSMRAGVVCARRAKGAARANDLRNLRYVLENDGLPARAIDVVAWAVGIERGFCKPAVIATHAQWAELLGCSQRAAGTAVRQAVAAGYLIRMPWFSLRPSALDGASKHVQRECTYKISEKFNAMRQSQSKRGVVVSLLAGKICQPTEKETATQSKGIPGNRPGGTSPLSREPERSPMTFERLTKVADDFQAVLASANAAFNKRVTGAN